MQWWFPGTSFQCNMVDDSFSSRLNDVVCGKIYTVQIDYRERRRVISSTTIQVRNQARRE